MALLIYNNGGQDNGGSHEKKKTISVKTNPAFLTILSQLQCPTVAEILNIHLEYIYAIQFENFVTEKQY